jgi:cytochrome c oxidase subunit IV
MITGQTLIRWSLIVALMLLAPLVGLPAWAGAVAAVFIAGIFE